MRKVGKTERALLRDLRTQADNRDRRHWVTLETHLRLPLGGKARSTGRRRMGAGTSLVARGWAERVGDGETYSESDATGSDRGHAIRFTITEAGRKAAKDLFSA